MASLPGGHINERSCAIRDVVAGDLPGASMETKGHFAHVLPQAVLDRPREGMVPDITARPTRVGLRAPAAGVLPPPRRNAMMAHQDALGGSRAGTERDRTRGLSGAERRWRSARAR